MKTLRYFLIASAVIGLTSFFATSCKDSNTDEDDDPVKDIEYVDTCIDDLVQVKSLYSAYRDIEPNPTGFAKAIYERFKDTQEEPAIGYYKNAINIFMDSSIPKLDAIEYVDLANCLLDNGVIGILKPTKKNYTQFITEMCKEFERQLGTLEVAIDEIGFIADIMNYMQDYILDIEKRYNDTDIIHDAIFLCEDDVYIVDNYGPEDVITYHVTTVEEDENDESKTEEKTEEYKVDKTDLSISDYWYGLMADNVIRWINEHFAERNSKAALPVKEVPVISKTGTIAYTNPVDSKQKRRVHYQADYKITSVYDTQNKQDVYHIKRSIIFHGEQLQCGPEAESSWYIVNNNEGYYGPFLSFIKVQDRPNGFNPTMNDYQPTNQITSSTYTKTTGFTVNAGLSISENPSLQLGGSYTSTEQVGASYPDIRLNMTTNTNSPRFEYTSSVLPKTKSNPFKRIAHESCKACMKQELRLEQSWIWRVNSPAPGTVYSLNSSNDVELKILYDYTKFIKRRYKYYSTNHHFDFNVVLPAPLRVIQKWRMSITKDGKAVEGLDAWMTSHYKDVYFVDQFQVAASTEQDRTGILQHINNLRKAMEKEKYLWQQNNYTGKFLFRVQNAAEGKPYKEFEYNVPEK